MHAKTERAVSPSGTLRGGGRRSIRGRGGPHRLRIESQAHGGQILSSHRSVTRLAGLLVVGSIALAACSSGTGASSAPSAAASAAGSGGSGGGSMDALVAAAKAEGGLNTIALPRDWCNYGAIIDGFTAKYGIPINGLNPGGGSKDELEAIKANKTNPGPQAPDVVDVGLSYGPQGGTEDLYQPYKVATWDSIPATAKDASGLWYGDYYGVLSFEVNSKVVTNVPKDWADLLKPEYKNMVALAGDPTASNQATSGVWASGFSQGGGVDNAEPGLQFFKQL